MIDLSQSPFIDKIGIVIKHANQQLIAELRAILKMETTRVMSIRSSQKDKYNVGLPHILEQWSRALNMIIVRSLHRPPRMRTMKPADRIMLLSFFWRM